MITLNVCIEKNKNKHLINITKFRSIERDIRCVGVVEDKTDILKDIICLLMRL